VNARSVFGFIGVVYAVGLCVHFWWVFVVVGVVLLVVWCVGGRGPKAGGGVRRSQAYYSNRR
jgi:hypothetical protein